MTLGAARLTDAAGRDLAPRQHKLLALLAYLARKATRPVPREELATLIWGERTDDQARGSLRQALFQLRRIVGDALEVEQGTVALKTGALDADVGALESDVAAGRYREAALRWHGDFLAGAEDAGGEAFRTWVDGERTYLRRLLPRAVEQLTADATARGAWSEAAAWADRWATVLPFDERPHRRLVEALSLSGRSAEAIARHAAYVARVRAELGADPSADFLRLGSQLEQRARASVPRAGAARDAAAAVQSPDLVGRESAFAELTDAWRDARRGEGVALAIEGDAGVGKTRLVEEFLRLIESQRGDAVVLRARAHAAEQEVPLSTARELLSHLRDAPGLLGAPRSAIAEVATLVPALGEHVKELPAPTGRPGALEEAVAQVIDDVAAEVPVMVFVDDLPRADAESRRIIASLARRGGTEPVLVIMTTGLAEADRVEMSKNVPTLRSIKLKPLEVAEVEAMLSSMVGLAQEERRFVAKQLVAETGGYPFDVVEVIRALADERLLVPDAAGCWRLSTSAREARLLIPPAVRAAIRQRLARLSGSAREVLEAAATIGGLFSASAIAELLGRDTAVVLDGLDELTARGLVRKASTVPARDEQDAISYEIAIGAARRVALEELSADRRLALRASARRGASSAARSADGVTTSLVRLDARYAIGGVLAEGRIVTSYVARDIRDDRDVELHVVRVPPVTTAERFLTTFERVAALVDPRIAPVVDFGVTSDALFYANARTGGLSLRERLARERLLPVEEAVQIAAEVARALAIAHAAGIVHGDLRAKHVTLASNGVVLGGLGLVEALGTQSGGAGPDGTGVTIGALAYLSPEQITGEAAADARSDIYSLGCVLYEMLAGELPFVGSHQALLARKLTQLAPSVRERRDCVSEPLEQLLRRCLARVPADRYRSVVDLLVDLERVAL